MARWVKLGVQRFQRGGLHWTPDMVWIKPDDGVIRLGGLFALGPSDRLDGAERSVEPGLLGGLYLIKGQTQVVLQVLIE